jgi:hypothetical protein
MAIVRSLESEYKKLLASIRTLLPTIPEKALYWRPELHFHDFENRSAGELFTEIGGTFEYVANGVLSNFWDHAAEWTMRESLPSADSIAEYIAEVEALTNTLFSNLSEQDSDKTLYLPNPRQTTIGELLVETLSEASHLRGQALACLRYHGEMRVPSFRTLSGNFER